MANFTDEAAVRLKFQIEDATAVSQSLINGCIADAHENILARLDSAVDTEAPDALLVQGETLLAGAAVLRGLASKDAAEYVQITLGGQRIDTGQRFATLITLAERTEEQAWETLSPYLAVPAGRNVADVTDSTPVLGE